MPAVLCPVCEDKLTIGITLKLYQKVTCPTCLTKLQVVSGNPLELHTLKKGSSYSSLYDNLSYASSNGRNNSNHSKKRTKRHKISDIFGGEEEFDETDEYLLEKQLRIKPERPSKNKNNNGR